jgi:hypothetical protein
MHVLEKWLVPRPLYPLLLLAAAVLLLRRRDQWRGLALPVLVAAAYPLLWGIFPVDGVIGEGRYVMFLNPFLALLLIRAAMNVPRQKLLAPAALVAGFLALSVAGADRITPYGGALALDAVVPRSTRPLVELLDEHHVRHFYANYWVAYRVDFETHERLIAAPITNDRYRAYTREVERDPHPAHVFLAGTRVEKPFRAYLDATGIPYEVVTRGPWRVYLFDRLVRPSQVTPRSWLL